MLTLFHTNSPPPAEDANAVAIITEKRAPLRAMHIIVGNASDNCRISRFATSMKLTGGLLRMLVNVNRSLPALVRVEAVEYPCPYTPRSASSARPPTDEARSITPGSKQPLIVGDPRGRICAAIRCVPGIRLNHSLAAKTTAA